MANRRIDDLDAQILHVLMTDGRASNVDIARTVNTSEATVRRRIDAMMEDGIFRVLAVADPYRIGLQVHLIVGISVDIRLLHAVAREVAALGPVRFLVYTTGPYDLLCQAYFGSNEEASVFLTESLPHIKGIVKTETATILKFLKRTWDFQLSSPEIRKAPLRTPE